MKQTREAEMPGRRLAQAPLNGCHGAWQVEPVEKPLSCLCCCSGQGLVDCNAWVTKSRAQGREWAREMMGRLASNGSERRCLL